MTSAARPPGLHDVARLAGVSHQTVSRVLNAKPRVRDETRRRVQWAVKELGYRPNIAARALVTRRSSTIGVITSPSTDWGPAGTLIAIEQAAREAGYYVSLAGSTGDAAAGVEADIDYFVDQGVDGIVVIAPEAAMAQVGHPLTAGVPMVMIAAGAGPVPGMRITSIDQEQGAVLATRHLIGLGHTAIAHVGGPPRWFDARTRRAGWLGELAAAGLTPGPVVEGDWSASSGQRAGRQLLAHDLPTAVFVANDLMAQGVIRALHDAGVGVPRDVSVVGFDDMPGVECLVPGLTTVRQDLDALGRQCIEMVLAAIRDEDDNRPSVAAELIVRESTAPPCR